LEITVKTFHGLEPVLMEELAALGATNIKELKRAVACEVDKKTLYRANLELRTALRILVPIFQFDAHSEDELYKKIHDWDWSAHLTIDQTFAIDSTVSSEVFTHSKYVALKTKDALVDQFREKTGKRPSVDVESPDLRINVHAYKTHFTISLDSSGDSLHRRGYRHPGHSAPLNEALAAGMVLLSGWDRETPLLDPMCGSGTILIEAAMLACNIPPRLKVEAFGFMNWSDYDAGLWQTVRSEAVANIKPGGPTLVGGDVQSTAVMMAKAAVERMDLADRIVIDRKPFRRLKAVGDKGMLIMNPPYGERLEPENILEFYKEIGDTLKLNFEGYDAWIISSNMDALKHVGLHASRRITLFNGSLECKFMKFSLYAGSKKGQ